VKTFYDILEVSRLASPEAIADSYRRLSDVYQRRIDPVSNNRAEIAARLDAVKRAYSVLADPDKRAEYDKRMADDERSRAARVNRVCKSIGSRPIRFIVKPLGYGLLLMVGYLALAMASGDATTVQRAATGMGDARCPEAPPVEAAARARAPADGEIVARSVDRAAEKLAEYEAALRERELERLALENQRLRRQVEAQRLEQERYDRALEQRASSDDRALRIGERRQDLLESETRAERGYADAQRTLDNLNAAYELQRDVTAAKLGITRGQYDRMEQAKFTEGSGWR